MLNKKSYVEIIKKRFKQQKSDKEDKKINSGRCWRDLENSVLIQRAEKTVKLVFLLFSGKERRKMVRGQRGMGHKADKNGDHQKAAMLSADLVESLRYCKETSGRNFYQCRYWWKKSWNKIKVVSLSSKPQLLTVVNR